MTTQMHVPLEVMACPESVLALHRHASGLSCQLSSTKGDAREHLDVECSYAVGAYVHLAALNAHTDALSARSESQPRQRAGLAQQSSYAGIHINDLQETALASQLCQQLGAHCACSFSAARAHNIVPGLYLGAWHTLVQKLVRQAQQIFLARAAVWGA